ncbi:hypothetical protein D3C76_917060 [compost metagenome]
MPNKILGCINAQANSKSGTNLLNPLYNIMYGIKVSSDSHDTEPSFSETLFFAPKGIINLEKYPASFIIFWNAVFSNSVPLEIVMVSEILKGRHSSAIAIFDVIIRNPVSFIYKIPLVCFMISQCIITLNE